jgi:hypothetical protein
MKPRHVIVIDRGTSRPWRERFRVARTLPDGAARLHDDRLADFALTEWANQTATTVLGLLRVIDGGRDERAPIESRRS